MKQIIKIRD